MGRRPVVLYLQAKSPASSCLSFSIPSNRLSTSDCPSSILIMALLVPHLHAHHLPLLDHPPSSFAVRVNGSRREFVEKFTQDNSGFQRNLHPHGSRTSMQEEDADPH